MNQGDKKKEYNAEDIRRYIAGDMSRAEMHAIENAALDDSFLSDAIEGYSDTIEKDGVERIDHARHDLQYDFEKRIKESRRKQARVVGFRRWQIAGAAAVIITTGILGYLAYEDKSGNPVLSANESSNSTTPRERETVDSGTQFSAADSGSRFKAPAIDAVKDLHTPNKAGETRDKETVEEALAERRKSVTTEAERQNTDSRARKQAAISIQSDAIITDTMHALASVDAGRTKTVVIPKETTTTEVIPDSIQRTEQPNVVASLEGRAAGVSVSRSRGRGTNARRPNIFRGRLLTPGDQPLSNALLKNVKTNESFMTDNNGNFIIPAADSVIHVDVSMVGHQPQRFTLEQNEAMNRLVLPPVEVTLSEVVVSGYGTEKKVDKTGAATSRQTNAVPEGGWQVLNTYITTQKSASLTNDPPLQVELTFTVARNGKLSGFSVARSVSPAHDQEAIRLIKNGPKWKVIKGRKAVVKVIVPL